MNRARLLFRLILYFSLIYETFSYAIEGLFPNTGPTDGATRVTIYSPGFRGLNYSSHPTPKCRFADSEPQIASWIHCAGPKSSKEKDKDETCLNCESTPHAAGDVPIRVSIIGDFTDAEQATFHYYPPPQVYWAEPFIGKKPGGTLVHIHGKDFENLPSLGCVFGSIIAPAKFISSTLINCRSPKSEVVDAVIPLKVTQNVQQTSQTWIKYYYYSVPEISQLVPDSGPTTGGTEIFIKGRQMYPFQVSQVYVHNTTYAKFGPGHYVRATVINTTHAMAVSPTSLTEGPVSVEITFNDQEWTKDGIPFYYYFPPFVLELVPNFGAVQGGTNVTVVGANFYDSPDIKCRFGKNVVQGHYIDPTQLWCLSPPTDKSGYVNFNLALTKERYSGNDLKYLYIDPPVITSITPMCGPTTGFTQLTVTGKNFVYIGLNKALCIFGDSYKQTATVVNDTLIYCDSPSVLDKFGNNVDSIWSLPLKITLNQVDYLNADRDFKYYTMPVMSYIKPLYGTTAGGTRVVAQLDNITNSCDLTCRFGTMVVPVQVTDGNEVTCTAPAVSCPGEAVVQVSLNNQQYTTNQYDNYPTIYYYYEKLIVAYATPDALPTTGGSDVTVYGEGFLMSKNSTTNPDGTPAIGYYCKFETVGGSILGTTTATYVDNNIIKCPSPSVDDPIDNVLLKVSPNGQDWEQTIVKNLHFYRAPEIISIDPKFGKIKQKGGKLNVNGRYFDCPDADCKDLKCAFSNPDMRVVTEGARQDSSKIICDIPPISRPEVTIVQITLNGIDYTTQNVTYTFYDAFILAVDPPYVPVEGNTVARLIGYGFADTGQLKVQLSESDTGNSLTCRGQPCSLDGKFISQSEIQFTVPAQAQVRDSSGNPIMFKPFTVELSVYDDSYTNNGVQMQYFEQPNVGLLTKDGSPLVFHTNAVETARIPVEIKIPPGSTKANFLNFAKIRCQYQVNAETIETVGIVANYPFPGLENANPANLPTRIECPTPKTNSVGPGTVSISLNGRDFVGSNPILVKPEIRITSVTPQCGPNAGGTPVNLGITGVDSDDLGKVFFTWSTVCTPAFTTEMLTAPNNVATVTPPVEYLQTSPGGTSLVMFSVDRIIEFNNGSQASIGRNYLDSPVEFLYYRPPMVVHTYPHSGYAGGGTPVIIDGAFFFSDTRHSCTPKCKFGDQIVEAEYLSTVRIRCISPAGTAGALVPLTVTMNGKDATQNTPDQSFTFTANPVIQSIHPNSGPTNGGTPILVLGQKFVDLSSFPSEFLCKFTSIDPKIPAKTTPASYLNDTTVICTSPGGWSAGNIARLQLSYNGEDFSNDNNTFRFYQVDSIYPVSAPSTGGTHVTIAGSGFQAEGDKQAAACKIKNTVTEAITVNWTHIICPVPPSADGPNYYGHEEFYYSLDGDDWHQIIQGFTYYDQPLVSQIIPPFIPKEGGTISVQGERFLSDWYGTKPSCKIGNTVTPAVYINSSFLDCTFPTIDAPDEQNQFVQVALNDVSFTDPTPGSRINVFYVTRMTPQSGILEGGTQIQMEGVNFPPNTVPLCRFGIKKRSSITYGKLISPQQLMCTSPAADLPKIAEYPLEVMFSLNFDDDKYRTWAWEGLHYYYYRQPEILNVQPKSALLDQTVMVNITSTPVRPFNDSLIGSVITKDVRMLSTDIICRFGRFGSTRGALVSNTQVSCPTPNNKLNLEEVGEEPVKIEVAMNGQDFVNPTSIYFKFVGTKSPTNYGIVWILAIIIGAIVLLLLLYFITKAFAGSSGVNVDNQPLNKPSYPAAGAGAGAVRGSTGFRQGV